MPGSWRTERSKTPGTVLHLLAIGIGIGGPIGTVDGLGTGVSYTRFVVLAPLATTAMNGALDETSFNMFFRLGLDRVHDSTTTTPLRVRDIVLGGILRSVLRGVIACAGFLLVVAGIGRVHSPWVLLALGTFGPEPPLAAVYLVPIGVAARIVVERPVTGP